MTLLILTIYVLAVARLTRLINADMVLDAPRLAIAARERQHRSVAEGLEVDLTQPKLHEYHRSLARRWQTALYFVQCPWCVGMWLALAGAIVPIRLIGWPWWALFPVGLAASHLIGVFAFAADTEDMDYEDETVN
jgi:hypothetical protein